MILSLLEHNPGCSVRVPRKRLVGLSLIVRSKGESARASNPLYSRLSLRVHPQPNLSGISDPGGQRVRAGPESNHYENASSASIRDPRVATSKITMSNELGEFPATHPQVHPSSSLESLVLIALVAVIVAMVALTAAFGGSPLTIAAVALLTAIPIAVLMIRFAVAREHRMVRLCQDYQSELNQWRERWQTLGQEAQQTTSALSKMRDGVIMLSQSGRILLINPAARRLLTLDPETNLSARMFVEVVRIPDLSQAVAAARDGGGTQKLLVEVTDGKVVRPVKVRVDRFDMLAESNLLMTLRDETEAHRVDEIRREFVANISHELKTPLAAIKGYAETVELAIKDDPDAAVHFMSQIGTQCLRLERLISDMMQLARAQAGRRHMKFSSVSLGDVITESIKSYQPIAESKKIELTVVPPPAEAQVRSDPEAMLTITNNLIGNAINYTPEGGQVRVSCREAGNRWALAVEDTGVGIPEREQKRIFERFYRVEKNRRSADGGTGIGLSIVKHLTVTLGGEIRVHSNPGEGSTFEVLLPSQDSHASS